MPLQYNRTWPAIHYCKTLPADCFTGCNGATYVFFNIEPITFQPYPFTTTPFGSLDVKI